MWAVASGFFVHNGRFVEAVPKGMGLHELCTTLNELDAAEKQEKIIALATQRVKELRADADQIEKYAAYLKRQ